MPENENYVNITDVKTQAIKLKTNQLIRILNISDQVDQAIDANQADEEQKICTNEIAHEKIKKNISIYLMKPRLILLNDILRRIKVDPRFEMIYLYHIRQCEE